MEITASALTIVKQKRCWPVSVVSVIQTTSTVLKENTGKKKEGTLPISPKAFANDGYGWSCSTAAPSAHLDVSRGFVRE